MTIATRVRQTRFESPAQRAVVGLLTAAGHVLRELDQVCARHGITHDQYNVLRILRGAHPEGHPRYEIAARLIDRAPDVTRLLDRLERGGLVERYRSDRDRRLSFSRITERGLELLREIDPEIRAVQERRAAPLSDAQLQELASLCEAFIPSD